MGSYQSSISQAKQNITCVVSRIQDFHIAPKISVDPNETFPLYSTGCPKMKSSHVLEFYTTWEYFWGTPYPVCGKSRIVTITANYPLHKLQSLVLCCHLL